MPNKKVAGLILLLLLLLLAASALAMLSGPAEFSLSAWGDILLGRGSDTALFVLRFLRLPRLAAGLLAGAGLAVAGTIIQTVFDNPLASPNLIGVNAGAGFSVVVCSMLFPTAYFLLPGAAFAGALSAMLFIYFLGSRARFSKLALILAGIAVNSLVNSATDFIYSVRDDAMLGSKLFRTGSLSAVDERVLAPAGLVILVAMVLAYLFRNELEVLSVGEETATSLGLRLKSYRFLFLILASVLAGASVSFAGLIGFMGLVVPHVARLLVGGEMRYLLPVSALTGALLLVSCDAASRLVFAPYEVPVGIVISLLGVPFFLWLLLRRKRSWQNA